MSRGRQPSSPPPVNAASGPPIAPVPLRWPHLAEPGALSGVAVQMSAGAAESERAWQRGRAEGLAETAGLRQQLAELCAQMAAERQASAGELGRAAVDAALTIMAAWLEGDEAERRARLAPVVARWSREVGGQPPAVAHVAPVDAAALRGAVAGLPIEVRVDPELSAGDVRLRSERAMIELRWRERLAELREELLAMYAEAAGAVAVAGEDDGGASAHQVNAARPAGDDAVPETLMNEALGSRP